MSEYAPSGPDVEPIEHYTDEGFHPINIGDIFSERYCVINKLGFGYNATVWFVEDLPLNRFASLKVIAADESASSSELLVCRHLQSQQEKYVAHPGSKHIVQIYDTFVIHGPNGTHHCIVTEILGISLAARVEIFYGEGYEHFPVEVTKKIAAQVALGVAYPHNCGVIHGDLHLANVLFFSPKLNVHPGKS